MLKIFLILFLFSSELFAKASAPWVGADFSGVACQGKKHGYGPFDYTNPSTKSSIPVVEEYHFTPDVENLIKGESGWLEGDLDYTLNSVPNHYRALLSIIRYQLKLNAHLFANPRPLIKPVECYFQRAINFSPRDGVTVSLYAHYMKEIGQLQKAAELYEKANTISPSNAKIEYSYALVLIDLKQNQKALELAKKAYSHGNPPKGLKNKLVKLGVWDNP